MQMSNAQNASLRISADDVSNPALAPVLDDRDIEITLPGLLRSLAAHRPAVADDVALTVGGDAGHSLSHGSALQLSEGQHADTDDVRAGALDQILPALDHVLRDLHTVREVDEGPTDAGSPHATAHRRGEGNEKRTHVQCLLACCQFRYAL